jgi:hypothetical protein
MSGLDDFRSQNPAYANVPDEQLADALYKKYYSAMPRDQFDTKLGIAAPGPKDPLADEMKEKGEAANSTFLHDVGQLAGGVLPERVNKDLGIPDAANDWDKSNRRAGAEMALTVGRRSSVGEGETLLKPPNFRTPDWSAGASPGSLAQIMKDAASNPTAKTIASHLASLGLQGTAVGSVLALLRKLGLW